MMTSNLLKEVDIEIVNRIFREVAMQRASSHHKGATIKTVILNLGEIMFESRIRRHRGLGMDQETGTATQVVLKVDQLQQQEHRLGLVRPLKHKKGHHPICSPA